MDSSEYWVWPTCFPITLTQRKHWSKVSANKDTWSCIRERLCSAVWRLVAMVDILKPGSLKCNCLHFFQVCLYLHVFWKLLVAIFDIETCLGPKVLGGGGFWIWIKNQHNKPQFGFLLEPKSKVRIWMLFENQNICPSLHYLSFCDKL